MTKAAPLDRRFSVAPMMDWTDRHCRFFHRLLTQRALLYTEMVVADAIRFGDADRLLAFDPREGPVALQLGGSDPRALAEAAAIAADYGYAEINLNVGCPSDRVQSGTFGACLMRTPDLVAECVAAMLAAVDAPLTVKCRIGVDEQDPETALYGLVDRCAAAGAGTFIVHARKAWLQGLSPKENRDVPPLDYELVRRLKADRPELEIILNGGLSDLDVAERESDGLDGVMLGRAAYKTPGLLGDVDRLVYGALTPRPDLHAVVHAMAGYAAEQAVAGVRLHSVTRHMLGLFHGRPGARMWRHILSTRANAPDAGPEVLLQALDAVQSEPALAA